MDPAKAALKEKIVLLELVFFNLRLSIKLFCMEDFNPRGESDQLTVNFNFLKIAERSEAKSAKRSFASKIKIQIF